ncbi:MAG: class I SAM-dependent methyltransferase [Flavobacteriales bacterium]
MKNEHQFGKDFEQQYIQVRTLENRVYSDHIVQKLPNLEANHPQCNEWQIRKSNAEKFANYISKEDLKNILEIGCGNGWFTHFMAKKTEAKLIGLDINNVELEQAKRLFNRENIKFVHGNIFDLTFENKFDLIVFNASIQYFPDIPILINTLKTMLSDFGEIHILDTFFYDDDKAKQIASDNTKKYYQNMGQENMIQYYFHHKKSDLFQFEIMNPIKSKVFSFFKRKKIHFPWYRWSKKK